jgi:hypothetical protein
MYVEQDFAFIICYLFIVSGYINITLCIIT